MTSDEHRSIKSIHNEINMVDKRIKSIMNLEKDYPNDAGLELSLIEFQGRKKDLLRELNDAKLERNIVSFDISLYDPNLGNITLDILGDIATKVNNVIRSFVMATEGPIKKKSPKKSDYVDDFKIQIDYVDIGSLKLTLSEANNIAHFDDSPLIDALGNFNELIECRDNKELIIKKMNIYGTKPIYNYKQLLNSIKENKIKLKLYENVKPTNFKEKKISYKFARSVYDVIDEVQESKPKKFIFTGVLYSANSETLRFGIKKGKEKYNGEFNKKLKNKVKSHYDETVTVLLEKTVKIHEVEGDESVNYELLKFLEENDN